MSFPTKHSCALALGVDLGDYIASLQGWIHTEYLPPYAPELNPVEWAHWKQHELPTVCPKDYYQLSEAARRTLRRMRRRPRLITAFGNKLLCGRNDSILCGSQ